ncbi:hypothetical protein [Planomonospora venezuelensis]|uniref:Uncharacterized protein n=1 Tax=Planomonospora venezuelensis TaxID=1999 RepID=A0A841D4J0_PLAVE|nr:hypothetical protein [Planomonospora venezuelensis]MBB5963327.1 hypothetical protein [Planomonospora venezuelensis]GIN02732.1 hypothetical protein Pve01_43900 [Planomonospora venezuelensis]
MTAPTTTAEWRSFCLDRGLRYDETIARGLDFTVLRMHGPDGEPLAVRVPHGRFSRDVNDPHVDQGAAELAAGPAFALYRLDAAVMLALVFTSEAPHPVLGARWTARAAALAAEISG